MRYEVLRIWIQIGSSGQWSLSVIFWYGSASSDAFLWLTECCESEFGLVRISNGLVDRNRHTAPIKQKWPIKGEKYYDVHVLTSSLFSLDSLRLLLDIRKFHEDHRWQNLPPVSLIPVANCGVPSLVNIYTNFRQNSKWHWCYFWGLGGRWFMKKPEAKISWHCLFKKCPGLLRNLLWKFRWAWTPCEGPKPWRTSSLCT